jgi:pimeloyl-ACP methyl ester carboxylesterase
MQWQIEQQTAYAYTGGKAFDASLPTVIFIHGAQNDHSVWGLQSRYLAHHGFGVLVPDLPGHGLSGGAALTSVEAMAAWILQLMDAAGVAQASLIGHSMGSLVALALHAIAPARVNKLALLGTAFPMKVSELLLTTARDDEARAIDMVSVWSHFGIAAKPSFPGPGFYLPNLNRRLAQRISKINPAQVYFTDFSACNNYAHGLLAAQAVRCPTLFICAMQDMMTTPKAAASLIAAIPHAQVLRLPACGHAMMAEKPDAVRDALLRLLMGVD